MSDHNPQDQAPAAPNNKNKAVISLVLGIAALFLAWTGWGAIAGVAAAIAALILAVGVRKGNNPAARGLATGGMVCAVIALVFCSITLIACTACAACSTCAAGEAGAAVNKWEALVEGWESPFGS